MSTQFRRVWTWPLVIGAFSASGLVSALVSDGWGDVWSWLGLALPVLVIARHAFGAGRPALAPTQEAQR